ncbi:MAG: prolipoprotein diacylglyceryl transferase, partial [Butyricicoccaceae bacterium]
MERIVSFPGLGLEFHINNVAFHIGDKPVYWYGVIIAVGFLLGYLYASRKAKRCGIRPDDLGDMALIALPVSIIGARIYYVLFRWKDYVENPSEIIAIWHGGLAIYGGVIAGALT